jgi:hypothetical protein
MSYQWQLNGMNIAGANSPVLRLNGVTGANAGVYTVTVSNSAGAANSNAATLSVTNVVAPVVLPTIVTQPTHLTVNVGGTAAFAVGVSGTGPFSFQWRRDGVNITGANSAVFALNSIALPNAGAYSVVVSNSAGAIVSSNAVLDVTASNTPLPPTITTQPASLILPRMGSSIMAVGATGTGPLSYQWYQDGVEIPFATQPVLNFFEVAEYSVGSYTVTVSNSVATRTSSAATFTLLGAPVITQEPTAATAVQNATATFSVSATGSGLRYQWSVNGVAISGATEPSYTTPALVMANSGAVYQARVYNGAGLVESQGAVLTVINVVPPSFLMQPGNRTVLAGDTGPLCVIIDGSGPFDATLQRLVSSDWVPVTDHIVINPNSAVCVSTPALQANDDGAVFRLVASNAAGSATSRGVTFTVTSPPTFIPTTLVSRAIAGGPPNNISDQPSMSADGRYIAFKSVGDNLNADAPTNGNAYVRDMVTGATELVNYNLAGNVSAQAVLNVKISSNGRFAVFTSAAGDLVAGDTNNGVDVFRRDLLDNTTERVSVLPNGTELPFGVGGNADYQLDISADGNVILFLCGYDIVGAGAENGNYFLYYRDMQSGFRGLVAGSLAYTLYYSALSDDGEHVAYAFGTPAPANQVIEDYDIEANVHGQLISFDQSASPVGLWEGMSISSNGQHVAFSMLSQDVFGSNQPQVVVVNRNFPGEYKLASSIQGIPGNGHSGWPEISGDGRFVVFSTIAPSLTNGLGSLGHPYTVVADIQEDYLYVASIGVNGDEVQAGTFPNENHAISEDGRRIAFVADYNFVVGGGFGNQVFTLNRSSNP